MKVKFSSSLCEYLSSFCSIIYWRGCPFPSACFWCFCGESVGCRNMDLFLDLYSVLLVGISLFMPISCCFGYHDFLYLEITYLWCLQLGSFYPILFWISGVFCTSMWVLGFCFFWGLSLVYLWVLNWSKIGKMKRVLMCKYEPFTVSCLLQSAGIRWIF